MKISFEVEPLHFTINQKSEDLEDILICKVVKIQKFWLFKFKSTVATGTEKEMQTLKENLTKLFGTN